MIFNKILMTLFVSMLLYSAVDAQIPGDRSKYYNYGARFYPELHILPSSSPDSAKSIAYLQDFLQHIEFH